MTDEERKIKEVEFALIGEFYIGQHVRHISQTRSHQSGVVIDHKRGYVQIRWFDQAVSWHATIYIRPA